MKRNLLIPLLVVGFSLAVIAVAQVMPYRAPHRASIQRNDLGNTPPKANPARNELRTDWQPEWGLSRADVLVLDGGGEPAIEPERPRKGFSDEADIVRGPSEIGPAGPEQASARRAGFCLSTPPGVWPSPETRPFAPEQGTREPLGPFYPSDGDSGSSGGSIGGGSTVPIAGSVWMLGSGLGIFVCYRKCPRCFGGAAVTRIIVKNKRRQSDQNF